MLQVCAGYIWGSAIMQFAPLIMDKIQGRTTMPAARRDRLLAKVPISTFGWHQLDMSQPLPPLTELSAHPIGIHAGRKVVLCHAEKAVDFAEVEFSEAFTNYYGERVYICYVS